MGRDSDRGSLIASPARLLTTDDLRGDPLAVARLLLGAELTAGAVTLRLTEVEAYHGERDPGSHGFRGMTPRTEVMFGPPGRLYVYRSYGVHWCCNIVCGAPGECAAVLLRAGEVLAGQEEAAVRRPGVDPHHLARGPGCLTKALGIGAEHNGARVTGSDAPFVLRVPPSPLPESAIRTGPRVGVSGPGGEGSVYPWRYWIDGNRTVSTYRPGTIRGVRAGQVP